MNPFRRLGLLIENRRLLVILVGVVMMVASVFGATRLTMASGIQTFLSAGSKTYQDYDRFNRHFSSDVVLVLVAGDSLDRLLQPDNLKAMEAVESQMAANPLVLSAVAPTSLLRQAQSQYPGVPLAALVVDPQTAQVRPQFQSAFPDARHALIAIVLRGGLAQKEEEQVVQETERVVAAAGFAGVEATVTGMPVFFTRLQDMMRSSLGQMFIVAVVLMLLILAFIFRVRGFFVWRWLPLGVVIIGIIYAFGAMGVLGVPITMVSMAVFPILLGLGVDYAIQFHNRYDEEARRGETVADAIIDSVTHIGPAIGIAIVAACLGFAALFFSPVPMVRDFGRMLIIGVIACYLVAVFLLLAILYWHDRRAAAKKTGARAGEERGGFVEKGLRRLAPRVIRNPALILPVALLATAGGLFADFQLETETDETKFISQNVPAIRDLRLLEKLSAGVSSASVLVEAKDVTQPEVLSWMAGLEQRLRAGHAEAIGGTSSVAGLVLQSSGGVLPQSSEEVRQILAPLPPTMKRNLVSDDYTAANMVIHLKELNLEQTRELVEQLSQELANHPEGLKAALTGSPVIGIKLFEALTSGRVRMTLLGVVFIFFGLLLLFRLNLFRAFAATLPIGLILGWSSGVMYVLGIKYNPLTATLGALILGIGAEFTILLMMRYYEERAKGEGAPEAMATAMTRIGRAIIASGLTVIGGFAALLMARDFPILRDFGIVTMINIFFALVSTLVVLPTLIVWFDQWRERRRRASLA